MEMKKQPLHAVMKKKKKGTIILKKKNLRQMCLYSIYITKKLFLNSFFVLHISCGTVCGLYIKILLES